jgi:NADH:ubiquinone oxidoreductase subunit 5 (subunit L)/multisubunit Na+/H+ antiporter MnhA subunit
MKIQILYGAIFFTVILVIWAIFTFSLPFILSAILFAMIGKNEDGDTTIGVVIGSIWLSWVLSPLSLMPAYLTSMRLVESLRIKRGWNIVHPRRLFLYSVVSLVGMIISLFAIGYFINLDK